MKVFLDTEAIVAAFATRGLCADVLRLTLAAHEMVVSQTVLAELERTLTQEIGLPERDVRSVVSFVREQATLVPDVTPKARVRNPKDVAILAAALAAGADALVTGDRDLLDLEAPAGIRVVTPRGFWRLAKAPAKD